MCTMSVCGFKWEEKILNRVSLWWGTNKTTNYLVRSTNLNTFGGRRETIDWLFRSCSALYVQLPALAMGEWHDDGVLYFVCLYITLSLSHSAWWWCSETNGNSGNESSWVTNPSHCRNACWVEMQKKRFLLPVYRPVCLSLSLSPGCPRISRRGFHKSRRWWGGIKTYQMTCQSEAKRYIRCQFANTIVIVPYPCYSFIERQDPPPPSSSSSFLVLLLSTDGQSSRGEMQQAISRYRI